MQVRSSLQQFIVCASSIIAASVLGLCRFNHCCRYWELKEKKKKEKKKECLVSPLVTVEIVIGEEKGEKSLLGFICSVLHASRSGFFFFSFAKAGMVFYERQSES